MSLRGVKPAATTPAIPGEDRLGRFRKVLDDTSPNIEGSN